MEAEFGAHIDRQDRSGLRVRSGPDRPTFLCQGKGRERKKKRRGSPQEFQRVEAWMTCPRDLYQLWMGISEELLIQRLSGISERGAFSGDLTATLFPMGCLTLLQKFLAQEYPTFPLRTTRFASAVAGHRLGTLEKQTTTISC